MGDFLGMLQAPPLFRYHFWPAFLKDLASILDCIFATKFLNFMGSDTVLSWRSDSKPIYCWQSDSDNKGRIQIWRFSNFNSDPDQFHPGRLDQLYMVSYFIRWTDSSILFWQALAVDPETGDMFFLTKDLSNWASDVYRYLRCTGVYRIFAMEGEGVLKG